MNGQDQALEEMQFEFYEMTPMSPIGEQVISIPDDPAPAPKEETDPPVTPTEDDPTPPVKPASSAEPMTVAKEDEDLLNGDDPVTEFAFDIVANKLQERGIIKEVPEGINPEQFTEDDFWKVVEHNVATKERAAYDLGIQDVQQELVSSLSPAAQKILDYNLSNPNLTDDEVLGFASSMTLSNVISELNPEDPGDAERIVREYYADEKWTSEEIDEKVTELAEADLLKKEAGRLKPKLDSKAQAIVNERIQAQKVIADQEQQQYASLQKRVIDKLNTGEINGIKITKEEAGLVYNAILNHNIDVPVRGGKRMKMGLAEALLYKHRYDQKNGNLDNLMLSILVMEHGTEAVKRFIEPQIKTKEVNTFIRKHKAVIDTQSGTPTKQQPVKGGLFSINR